jgi:hypothetical protein
MIYEKRIQFLVSTVAVSDYRTDGARLGKACKGRGSFCGDHGPYVIFDNIENVRRELEKG